MSAGGHGFFKNWPALNRLRHNIVQRGRNMIRSFYAFTCLEMARRLHRCRPSSRAFRSKWPAAVFSSSGVAGLSLGPAFAAQGGIDLALPDLSPARLDMAHASVPLGFILMVVLLYAGSISIQYIRSRRLWNEQNEDQNRTIREAQAKLERASLFLMADHRLIIAWGGPEGEPEFEGDAGLVLEANSPQRTLSFSEWLNMEDARRLDRHVMQLRTDGTAFSMVLTTLQGESVEIEGQPIAGRAVMAIRRATGERLALARLQDEKKALEVAQNLLRNVLEAIPQPVWLRDSSGRLGWVNSAYAQAVDAGDARLALAQQAEFLDSEDRALIRQAQSGGGRYRGAVTAIVAGERRKVDVTEVLGPEGGGGFALDISELEATRQALERQMDAHVRTLDELPTAVAIFDQRQQLVYSNRAFRDLFALDQAYLATRPGNGEMLDRLRANGRLPEAADYRDWKGDILAQYAATETSEQGWTLPNGRALRVVITPNPQGGVTYLFEDETERMTLATSYDALKNTQWETLMALSEGVGVFGSDGCLQLSNPAFATLWGMPAEALQGKPHVGEVGRACAACPGPIWREVAEVVCSLSDARLEHHFSTQTADGRVLAVATTPLPAGATLVTVTDVTDTVEAERRLREHNEALKQAARLRTDFIRNVSFELRLPLTSVVGLAQALAGGIAGALTPRQQAYTEDLARASDAVLALTSDIIDLASIETGLIELEREPVDLPKAIEEATEGLKDRLSDAKIRLAINVSGGLTHIMADPGRLRHILFNLLANALAFSGEGDVVRLSARKTGTGALIEVSDANRNPNLVESTQQGHETAGIERENRLRFSLARALVQLHGGSIAASDDPKGGTLVSVLIPDA